MSIKPVRSHTRACNVWLRIDPLKEIRGTLCKFVYIPKALTRKCIYVDISAHNRAHHVAEDGLPMYFASYHLM